MMSTVTMVTANMSWTRIREPEIDVLSQNISTFFLMVCGGIVFFMHSGFAFLEAGTVRTKNTTNIMLKNLMDSCIGGLMYWVVGFGLAYGQGNAFIGADFFFLKQFKHYVAYPYVDAFFFFQFSFAAACTSIIAGGVAERTTFFAYMIYSAINTGFIYPVVSHWAWYKGGWLQVGVKGGLPFQDFAGSGVVHATGGSVALVGAAILRPRIGRYNAQGKVQPLEEYNTSHIALGTFTLLFGFISFNGGSVLSMSNAGDNEKAARAITSTFLSFSAGGLATLLVCRVVGGSKKWSFISAANGSLTGAVAICAGCDAMQGWAAVLTGSFAGLVYLAWSWIIPRLGIDDPLDAAAVHLGGGLWGLVAAPLFHERNGVFQSFSRLSFAGLGWNILGGFVIMVWSSAMAAILFGTLRLFGKLRISDVEEEIGLDITTHGERAYPWALNVYSSQTTDSSVYTDFSETPGGSKTTLQMEGGPSSQNSASLELTTQPTIDEKTKLVANQ